MKDKDNSLKREKGITSDVSRASFTAVETLRLPEKLVEIISNPESIRSYALALEREVDSVSESQGDSELGSKSELERAIKHIEDIAGIKLPDNRKQLYIKASDVYYFVQNAGDAAIFLTLGGISGGAALGIIVNVITSSELVIGAPARVALIIFSILTIVWWVLYNRSSKRNNPIKELIETSRKNTEEG